MLSNWSLNVYPRALPISTRHRKIAKRIISLERKMSQLSAEELQNYVCDIRNKIDCEPKKAKDFLVEGFALVREASWRIVEMRHYEVQILAGICLFEGAFVEMATGEGKTLTATLPVFMWALSGKGVHVHTTNSYLAERDFELMSPVYEFLGMSCGLLCQGDTPVIKKKSYDCDITYGVGSEYGFDYMRDQLAILNTAKPKLGKTFMASMYGYKPRKVFKMQRDLAFALIDEVDSVLLDEARSPLVISGAKGGVDPNAHIYKSANSIATSLVLDEDFILNKSKRSIDILECAKQKIYEIAPPKGLVAPWSFYIRQALSAHHFFQKNVHYMVDEGKIVIVDEYTGRRFAERTWRDGLHQAIEAKEKITITEASKSAARITRQRYFSFYERIAGMTGTAQGSEKEIWKFYRAPVIKIPPRKKIQRIELRDKVFGTLEAKWCAVEQKICELYKCKQPVLVGTRTIESSEKLALRLQKLGLNPQVLNAKQDAEEAKIISSAGQVGAITIATNMAGRGTDVHLGDGVEKLGGLFVLGTERHESRRVDNQLIGRCGRQGNVGIAQFFISFADDLIVQHLPKITDKFGDKNELPSHYTRIFTKLQNQLEAMHFEQRKQMYHFDTWVEEVLHMMG
ncbi:preprotein translocase subunit SecA [Candidatus Uabimicrobium sp. HlEnr_7]|uniref:preprotein translocase subunit SecA n=1 Tax=Candidatus Uabimicrobium helgolandensis TaxID=3095367 RepID=UPI003556F2AC